MTDSNTNGLPDVAEAAPPQPYASNTSDSSADGYTVSLTQYDSAGRAYRTIDNIGRINETQYDDAGRAVKTIQDYQNGTVEETDTAQDITVAYEYDSAGRLVTQTAYNAKGTGNGVQSQATKYLYTSTVNASWQTAAVYPDSADVLSQDGTTKVWTITTDNGDHTSTAYDRLGRTTGTTDQRGVTHQYTFDSAGRLSADTATSLGSSGIVDGSIRRIGTSYDDMGRVQYVTSYSDTSGATAVNQVKYEYNGWQQVYREYEEHDGAVDGSTLFVQYDYADGAAGGVAKYVRLDEVTYPNGREVHYDYGTTGAIDDIMSRLSSIYDDANDDGDIDAGEDVYAGYKYLGGGTIVEEDYVESQTKLSYLNAAGTNVTGMDRFGRVTDQVWTDYGANPDTVIDEYTYTYDRVGNRTSKGNTLHTAFNETYTYDALDRLTSTDRADGTSNDQTWGLDGLGNFATFNDGGTSQTRTVDAANEITGISGSSKTPAYDAAGNMKFGPKPGNDTTGMHYVYDAWNRLVAVYQDDGDGVYEPGTGDALVATYKYDGVNRRIEKVVTGTSDVHYYYNQQWQMLEERFVSGGTLLASNQYVWSPRYVDSPIVRFHDGNGDGDYLDAGDNIRYYTTDANHNVTATIDATTGNVVERYVYNAYGKATVYSPTWTNPAAPTTDGPLYCGYFFDAESNLYQVRNRYYDSGLSTFISRDPIGYAAGDFNLYRYCGNDPTRAVDPLGLDDIVIAGPGSKLSIDEWFQKFIWEPLQRNGGTSLPRGRLLDVLRAGCIGLATLMNQLNAPVLDPRTGEFLGNMPDLRMGFATLPEAIKYRDEQDKDHPIKWTGTTISGNAPQYRVFAVLYSSKNESYPTAEPQRRGDGSYDLSTQDVMLTIAERSRPRATRFDFFTLSVLGDPWYDAQHPWVHATEGGKDMTLKATDNKGIEREKNNNNSDFDRLFYFVACERQF